MAEINSRKDVSFVLDRFYEMGDIDFSIKKDFEKKILEIIDSDLGYQILDVRSDDERNGINLRGGYRGGYIPNSAHKEWINFNTDGDIPILKSSEEILSIAKSMNLDPQKPTITYCQGGIRAAHVFWALKLAGFSKVLNYDALKKRNLNDLFMEEKFG